jgi:hypothetical protein
MSLCPHGQPWHDCLKPDCEQLAQRVSDLSTSVHFVRNLRAIGTLIHRCGMRCADRDGSMVGVELDRAGLHVLQAGYRVWHAAFPCQDRYCRCYVRIGQEHRG